MQTVLRYSIPILISSIGLLSNDAHSATCAPVIGGANVTINSDCEQLVLDSAGEVTVSSGVIVSGDQAILNATNSSTGSLTINGTVSSSNNESSIYIQSGSTLNAVTNFGTISSGGSFGGISVGVYIEYQPRTTNIIGFTNNGTISVGDGAIGLENTGGIISLLDNSGIISTGDFNINIPIAIRNSFGGLITTLNNSGTLSVGMDGYGIYNDGTITTLNNSGAVNTGAGGTGIYNYDDGIINTLVNTDEINNIGGTGIYNDGLIEVLSNAGQINSTSVGGDNGEGITNQGTINALTNEISGSLTAADLGSGIWNRSTGMIDQLSNKGGITAGVNGYGIYNDGTITTLINSGAFNTGAGGTGIYNDGLIGRLGNAGQINTTSLGGDNGEGITNGGTINAVTNEIGGSITATDFGSGIWNRSTGTIDELSNKGAITAGVNGYGIYNDGTITALNNSGTITLGNVGTGIENYFTITTLSNTGTISIEDDGWGIYSVGTINILNNSGTITVKNDGAGIFNDGTIDTLTNSGFISTGAQVNGSAIGIVNDSNGIISTLNNTGTISVGAEGYGIYNVGDIMTFNNSGTIAVVSGFGIENNFGFIDTLNNSGSIQIEGDGIGVSTLNGGTINTITNSGSIQINGDGVGIANRATINTLVNSGNISIGGLGSGVNNQGTITTLDNSQGGNGSSRATTGLTYDGNLPTNYNVILNSLTHYGQLATQTSLGVTTFGISPLSRKNSTILNTTLTSVLSGVTPAQLGLTGLSSFSGLSNGFSYTLYLTDLATNTWGLIVTACNNCDIYSGMSVSLSDIDVTVYPVLAGGTLVLNNGDNSNQAFAVTANSTITSPTSGIATLSGVFSGSGGLTFTGTGTTILSGANTYSGGTTIASGTLQGNITSLQGAIVNNSQVVFDQSTDGAYSGVMSGTGALTKQNVGTLILTGANTYSGGTTVAAGTLSVSGASPTGFGDVSVSSGATLMGTGTINGQLTVAGILKPGNSPGYLAATNTVTMNAGSTYLQDIAGTAQASSTSPVGAAGYYSFLNVTTGQFVIQPGSTLTPRLSNLFTSGQAGFGSAIYAPGLGDRLRIVTADGGISGRFSMVTQPAELAAGTQFLPFYNMAGSNSIDLAVIPTSYQATIASASGNANAQSVGGALTQLAQASLAGTATVAQDQLLYAISGQTSAQGIANLAQGMSGEVYAATVAVMAQTTQRTQQAVLNRLGDTAGLRLNMPMASSKAEAKSFANDNVWGELAYQRGKRASDRQSGGWGSNLYQLTFGSDFYSYNGTVAGAGFALSSTTLNPTYGASTIQQASLFAYGKMPVESFVLDATASVGLSSSDIKRGDVTGLSAGFRKKSVLGNDVMVSLGLSRPFDAASVRLTPFARVTWQMVTQSGVNEGDAASALSVNRYTGNGVRGVIGLAAGSKANNPMTAKNTYRAYVGVGADSSGLLNPTLNASLAGIGTNISTPNAGTAFVQAGLYGTAKMSENSFAYAGISGEARSGQTLGTVNIGLSMRF